MKSEPELVGGVLCLDFANHLSHLFSDNYKIGEAQFRDLVAWSVEAGGLSATDAASLKKLAAGRDNDIACVLRRAERLSRTLRGVFTAAAQDHAPDGREMSALSREVASAKKNCRVVFKDSDYRWEWSKDTPALDRVLWPIANSAGNLLTSDDLRQVKVCDAENCYWLFLDSGRGRRRWCDMKICGNRTKVKRFRAKRSA